MLKYLIGFAVVAMTVATAQPAHAGAVAICIQKEKNKAGNNYDSEYFLRHGKSPNVNGYVAWRAARKDHRESYPESRNPKAPYCRHNGYTLADGGYFIIIKGGRDKDHVGEHYNRWALGFGKTRADALADAKKELGQRDWSWNLKKHGYEIEEENAI